MDDIEALREHAITEKYTFLVDSRDRDREAYPTPSEYVVSFDQPFRNVIGFEVLEASIPRTMYNIDVTNNTLYFYIHSGDAVIYETVTEDDFIKVEIPTGDYSVSTLLPAINRLTRVMIDGNPVQLTVEPLSQPPEVKSTLRFRCPYPFILDMARSTIAEVLGFDLYGVKSFAFTRLPQPQYKLFESTLTATTVATPVVSTLFVGPTAVSTFYVGTVRQRFEVDTPVSLKTLRVATYKGAGAPTNPVMTYKIYRAGAGAGAGDILAQGTFGVTYSDGRLDEFQVADGIFLTPAFYWLELSSTDADVGVFYNDLSLVESGYTEDPDFLLGGAPVQPLTVQYRLCGQILGEDPNHIVTAPGLYNLTGERYILLRCKEIEENSYRSLSYSKYHLGVAKFRTIYSPSGAYNEMEAPTARLQEHSVREFHPIGKLNRITLRFERANGQLYDFKGVNHTITFMIKYLEPARKAPWTRFTLNENYNPNFIKYAHGQQDQEGSSDEEDPYSRDNWRTKYQLHEDLYKTESLTMQDRQKKIMQALNEDDDDSSGMDE